MLFRTLRTHRCAMLLALLLAVPCSWAQPDDAYFASEGSWGQAHADQYGLAQIGLGPGDKKVWRDILRLGNPVVVAVIDTGLDYYHPDFNRDNLWRNPNETENGRDDDGNGLVDDLIGWNFYDETNRPWDRAGHGTFVAGIIAAATNNGRGIAGMAPMVRVMPLKVLNFIGRGRSTRIAAAIYYAVENGAQIINLSLGGHEVSKIEQRALDFAWQKGVLIVVSAGNEAVVTTEYGMAAHPAVITVGATGPDGKRAAFSNWGAEVDIAAPGFDILSLRARRTDFSLAAQAVGYFAGEAFVGEGARYYRASGTSFSAPFVTGAAALLLASDPSLDAPALKRILLQTARDIEEPGKDQFTGYGLLNVPAALAADADFYVEATISGVQVVLEDGQPQIRVLGSAAADDPREAWLEIAPADQPDQWQRAAGVKRLPVTTGVLGDIPAIKLQGVNSWLLRLVVKHNNGTQREARFQLDLG